METGLVRINDGEVSFGAAVVEVAKVFADAISPFPTLGRLAAELSGLALELKRLEAEEKAVEVRYRIVRAHIEQRRAVIDHILRTLLGQGARVERQLKDMERRAEIVLPQLPHLLADDRYRVALNTVNEIHTMQTTLLLGHGQQMMHTNLALIRMVSGNPPAIEA